MKLYYHPASTVSRPVMLFIAESGINVEMQVVDLFTGEHMQPPYEAVNPNKLVPTLEDGDFRLTESSAILKYLADSANSPAYPKDLRQRARVNERMDLINTQVNRDLCYGFVYPQIFPNHKRATEAEQRAAVEWGRERAKGWLKALDQAWIGPKNSYLCGESITIADYLGAPIVAMGDTVKSDFSVYPNVSRWLGNMKKLKSWDQVNEVINGYAGTLKDVVGL